VPPADAVDPDPEELAVAAVPLEPIIALARMYLPLRAAPDVLEPVVPGVAPLIPEPASWTQPTTVTELSVVVPLFPLGVVPVCDAAVTSALAPIAIAIAVHIRCFISSASATPAKQAAHHWIRGAVHARKNSGSGPH
jgi:hypothetical protein